MGRLLTKATWGILPRAAFAFSDKSCGAIVRLARLAAVAAAADGAVTAAMGDSRGCG